jgi:hypothetical protein
MKWRHFTSFTLCASLSVYKAFRCDIPSLCDEFFSAWYGLDQIISTWSREVFNCTTHTHIRVIYMGAKSSPCERSCSSIGVCRGIGLPESFQASLDPAMTAP